MGNLCKGEGPIVVPVPFPQDGVALAFFGRPNLEVCVRYLAQCAQGSAERREALLKGVAPYAVEVLNEEDVCTDVVEVQDLALEILQMNDWIEHPTAPMPFSEDPADEEKAIEFTMSQFNMERRLLALCNVFHNKLAAAGLEFTTELDAGLLRHHLPHPLTTEQLRVLAKLFNKINVSRSGSITFAELAAWLQSKCAGTALAPLVWIAIFGLTPTTTRFELSAYEFILAVHRLCCIEEEDWPHVAFVGLVTTTELSATGSRIGRRARQKRQSQMSAAGIDTIHEEPHHAMRPMGEGFVSPAGDSKPTIDAISEPDGDGSTDDDGTTSVSHVAPRGLSILSLQYLQAVESSVGGEPHRRHQSTELLMQKMIVQCGDAPGITEEQFKTMDSESAAIIAPLVAAQNAFRRQTFGTAWWVQRAFVVRDATQRLHETSELLYDVDPDSHMRSPQQASPAMPRMRIRDTLVQSVERPVMADTTQVQSLDQPAVESAMVQDDMQVQPMEESVEQ